MTLAVARLGPASRKLGAEVFLTRGKPAPVTSLSVDQLQIIAAESLADQGIPNNELSLSEERSGSLSSAAEIRRRKPSQPRHCPTWSSVFILTRRVMPITQLVEQNHLHLITGALSSQEIVTKINATTCSSSCSIARFWRRPPRPTSSPGKMAAGHRPAAILYRTGRRSG